MERRLSLPQATSSRFRTQAAGDDVAAARLSSPQSDGTTSPFRRRSVSFSSYKNQGSSASDEGLMGSPTHPSFVRPPSSPFHRLSLPVNAPSSPSRSNRKSDSPLKLNKQRSIDEIHNRILWPSSKKPSPAAVAAVVNHIDNDESRDSINNDVESRSATATYDSSTFSSRQRLGSSENYTELEDRRGERGGRSLRHYIGKQHIERTLKKPGTPPSPSSASTGLQPSLKVLPGRLSFHGTSLTRRRSNFGHEIQNNETKHGEASNPHPALASRRPNSPARRPGSPVKGRTGGVGSLISQGLSNLFRRKSFHGASTESMKARSSSPVVVGSAGGEPATTGKISVSPAKGESVVVNSVGSPGEETAMVSRFNGSPARGRTAPGEGELQHQLKMMHNHLTQWRLVNARTEEVNNVMGTTAQSLLMSAWLGLSDMQLFIAHKRLQLQKEKFLFKLGMLLFHQTTALEKWVAMEKQHIAALSSTKDSLGIVVSKLPLTDRAMVKPKSLSVLLQQATSLATAINGNITSNSMAQATVPLVAQLAEVVAREKHLSEECFELLRLFSTMQVQEESLRCHLIQLKSQEWTKVCSQMGTTSWP
ncbi:hypothetical protein AXF42_Ash016254 [Apostasia shenzhenica]|uniref:QWRF motif-containing protein 3 n=1 Tax=Apostasia shenzhenica TaxID=1088818 RepID=A0A2H9ZX74_9ASPA|nr:hypothetical protein AXF42_Ash016254 [Apostasia shenzhenica]